MKDKYTLQVSGFINEGYFDNKTKK